ncbi:MAG TPA: pyridoxal phosphate-dependent aminotransferase family protein [Dictyoglomaceae bacterium]|mgnify:CR=1 FL=1|nr:pyridoxal phosphate-dependent aminotransferase family protein [Dictyoglomaceae bacterium]HOL39052.1 pyridoxal phosphate-dependent aminotransferase family protein [Dictyoglomaceae bacterium]HOP94391.1 pyridoxal phosphate-dependent aminotransferase family protein [Dictyoglomaceae bacterium]HPP15772.1 pyridoxal phosphate-dependent aminotransferase family protein [Dictyoglomaceae bacterium]HPU42761.1 pyridoxal phosphate-dependent aminotransferase family protein [Dictyoglomaceae bacterium]
MDLFEKFRDIGPDHFLSEARFAIEQGIYPFFLPLEETEGTEVVINGRRLIMLGSNNYLGLTTHPKVKEAAIKAIKEYGTSCTGSRFMNGTLKLHKELEQKLAEFLNKEAALVFSTGYQTNLGTISALIGKGDITITDKEDHASIIDGCKLSFGEMRRFKHNDMVDLEKVLASCPEDAGKLIIVDGIFSMAGDIAPLPEIVKLCKKYGARLMVDDAHSIGVLGDHGRGTANHFDLENEVDIIMGTFSKSFASLGGFIAGDEDVIFYVQHVARSFIFSASMSPANTAAAMAALEVMQEEPERTEYLWKIANRMREGLKSLGFDTGDSCTPVIPIYIRDRWKTIYLWKELFNLGVYCNPVLPPGVAPNQSLLRTSYMATHTEEQIDRSLEIFEKAGKKIGII